MVLIIRGGVGTLNKLPGGDNVFMAFQKTIGGSTSPTALALLTAADVNGFGDVRPETDETATLLSAAERQFSVMLPQQYPTYTSQAPFFYADSRRVFFVQPRDEYRMLGDYGGVAGGPWVPPQREAPGEPAGFGQVWLAIPARARGRAAVQRRRRAVFPGNQASGLVIDRGKAAGWLMCGTRLRRPAETAAPSRRGS